MIWALLFTVVKKVVSATLLAIAFLAFLYYLLQVLLRAGEGPWYTELSDNDGGAYTVKYAYVGENWISLKLYKTGEEELLAERTYQFIGEKKFIWTNYSFIYDTSDNSFYYDGQIFLPPTKIDRWLARLP